MCCVLYVLTSPVTGWFLPHTKLLLIFDDVYTAVALQGILFHSYNSTVLCFYQDLKHSASIRHG